MTKSDWLVIGGIAVPIVSSAFGWLIVRGLRWKGRVDEKLAGVLMEDKHNDICTRRTAELQKSVDGMRCDLERRFSAIEESVATTREDLRDELGEHRRETRETLTEIRNSITGTHKRLDQFLLNDRSGGR